MLPFLVPRNTGSSWPEKSIDTFSLNNRILNMREKWWKTQIKVVSWLSFIIICMKVIGDSYRFLFDLRLLYLPTDNSPELIWFEQLKWDVKGNWRIYKTAFWIHEKTCSPRGAIIKTNMRMIFVGIKTRFMKCGKVLHEHVMCCMSHPIAICQKVH